jgi:hypothetical protein
LDLKQEIQIQIQTHTHTHTHTHARTHAYIHTHERTCINNLNTSHTSYEHQPRMCQSHQIAEKNRSQKNTSTNRG